MALVCCSSLSVMSLLDSPQDDNCDVCSNSELRFSKKINQCSSDTFGFIMYMTILSQRNSDKCRNKTKK